MRAPLLVLLLLTGCTSTGYASLDTAELDERDPRRLTLQGIHGACDTVRPPEVDEDDEQVRVTVPLRVEPGGCDDVGLLLSLPLRLDAPLGQRRVVDARSGRTLPVVGRDRCRTPADSDLAYLGMTLREVEARAARDGFAQVRVTCQDGRELDRTSDRPSDRRSDRVDVTVDDGRVSSAVVF